MVEISVARAVVDDEDEEKVATFRWNLDADGYATASVPRQHGDPERTVKMHRLVLGLQKGDPDVDHINGDKLDNRKVNLRPATSQQNHRNRPKGRRGSSSIYKGVSWDRSRAKWFASITAGRLINLGRFDSEIEAARAYDAAAREHFGEFAHPNFE